MHSESAQAVAGTGRSAFRWVKGPAHTDVDPIAHGCGQTGRLGPDATAEPWWRLWNEHPNKPSGLPLNHECAP
eukprot:764659-Amphidinium_carterae.1